MKKEIPKNQQASAAIAARVTGDDLTDFMDRVAARLDEYDKAAEDSVVARPTKSDH